MEEGKGRKSDREEDQACCKRIKSYERGAWGGDQSKPDTMADRQGGDIWQSNRIEAKNRACRGYKYTGHIILL